MADAIDLAKRRYLKSIATTKAPPFEKLDAMVMAVMLQDANLTELPSLVCFSKAQKIYAQHNAIQTVVDQENDTVEDVDLSHNRLESLPKIGGRSLFTLNVSNNLLHDIHVRRLYTSMALLNVSNQPGDVFSDSFAVELAGCMPRLQVLIADRVNAVDLSFVSPKATLVALSAKENLVQNVEDVLPYLSETLQKLDLAGNPVLKKRGLLELVCARCPQLRLWNGKELTPEQVRFAAEKAKHM